MYEHGKTAPRRIDAVLFVKRHSLFVHLPPLSDVLFGFFVLGFESLDFGLQLLHLGHRFCAAVSQWEKYDLDDDGEDDNAESPVRHGGVDGFDRLIEDFSDHPEEAVFDDFCGIVTECFQSLMLFRAEVCFADQVRRQEEVRLFSDVFLEKLGLRLSGGSDKKSRKILVFVPGPLDDILSGINTLFRFILSLIDVVELLSIMDGDPGRSPKALFLLFGRRVSQAWSPENQGCDPLSVFPDVDLGPESVGAVLESQDLFDTVSLVIGILEPERARLSAGKLQSVRGYVVQGAVDLTIEIRIVGPQDKRIRCDLFGEA